MPPAGRQKATGPPAAANSPGAAGPPGPSDAEAAAGWNAAQEKAFLAEKNTAWVRLAIIAFNIGVYYLLLPAGWGVPALAAAVSVTAASYAVLVVTFQPYRRIPVLRTALFTAATDATLITLWLIATGGPQSPFYLLWFVSLFAVAFRYRFQATLLAAGIYILCEGAILLATGHLAAQPVESLVRLVYILFAGALGGLLARETYHQVHSQVTLRQRMAVEAERRRQNERFRVLAESTMEGICLHEGGRVLDVNQAFCDLLARPRNELVGESVARLVDAESRADVEGRLENPDDSPYEVWIQPAGGERRLVEVRGRDLPMSGRRVRVVAVQDITDRREAEQARRQALEKQLEVDRLQDVDRFKTTLLNTASHELNTPLTPLKMQVHLLGDGRLGALSPRQQRSMGIIQRNVDRLATLVSDVLDVARLESGRLRMAPKTVDVAEAVHETVDAFQDTAAAQGVGLAAAGTGGPVRADPDRLVQVLYNLVSNAIKFTPPGGRVTVHADRRGELVELRVHDTGAGLTAAQIERLFRPFSQVHDHSHADLPGTGLGLYICKGIVDGLGGRMWVESPGPGQGSTFSVRLPRADAKRTASARPVAAAAE